MHNAHIVASAVLIPPPPPSSVRFQRVGQPASEPASEQPVGASKPTGVAHPLQRRPSSEPPASALTALTAWPPNDLQARCRRPLKRMDFVAERGAKLLSLLPPRFPRGAPARSSGSAAAGDCIWASQLGESSWAPTCSPLLAHWLPSGRPSGASERGNHNDHLWLSRRRALANWAFFAAGQQQQETAGGRPLARPPQTGCGRSFQPFGWGAGCEAKMSWPVGPSRLSDLDNDVYFSSECPMINRRPATERRSAGGPANSREQSAECAFQCSVLSQVCFRFGKKNSPSLEHVDLAEKKLSAERPKKLLQKGPPKSQKLHNGHTNGALSRRKLEGAPKPPPAALRPPRASLSDNWAS